MQYLKSAVDSDVTSRYLNRIAKIAGHFSDITSVIYAICSKTIQIKISIIVISVVSASWAALTNLSIVIRARCATEIFLVAQNIDVSRIYGTKIAVYAVKRSSPPVPNLADCHAAIIYTKIAE